MGSWSSLAWFTEFSAEYIHGGSQSIAKHVAKHVAQTPALSWLGKALRKDGLSRLEHGQSLRWQ